MTEWTIKSEIVVVNVRGPGRFGGVLRNPEIISIDGKKFISGISFRRDHSWSDEQREHIALDEVSLIVEFATVAEHEAKCKWARRRSRGLFAKLRRR